MKAFVITPFTAERAGREAPDVFAAVQAAIVEAAVRAGDALVDVCERREDRIAMVATAGGEHDSQRLMPRRDARYAVAYYPWVRSGAEGVLVPPVGHVAGASPGVMRRRASISHRSESV